MSDTVTLNTPLMSREQEQEQRDSINNLLGWGIWATCVLFVFCVFLDGCVIAVIEDWYVSNHPGILQDEVAMGLMSIYLLLLYLVVALIQAPPIFFGVTPVILTFGRDSSVAKRWVVNVLRDGGMRSGF